MTKNAFIQQRRASWRRFEALSSRARAAGTRKFSSQEISLYSRLLREVSRDLAIVRSHGWDPRLEQYLNELAATGYNNFYRSPSGTWRQILRFVTTDYPRKVRAYGVAILLGCALFFVPFIAAWSAVYAEPQRVERILGAEQTEQIDEMYGPESPLGSPTDISAIPDYVDERSGMFGFYIFNNIGIAFRTFALGLTFAVGTVYTLLSNGIQIGAIVGHVHASGNGERLFSFIVTHGSFELTAIGIAGGAGLILGNALLHPGQRTRWEALKVQGLDAIQIAGGAGLMLLAAAFLEAYWSPAPIAPIYKYIVGVVAWVMVIAYLVFAGRWSRGATP